MLAALICAMFCGHIGYRATLRWLYVHGTQVWHVLGFRRKPPVRQSFADLLARLDVAKFQEVLLAFVEQLGGDSAALFHDTRDARTSDAPSTDLNTTVDVDAEASDTPAALDVEVWDGKTLCGTRDGETRAVQVLVRLRAALKTVISSVAIPADTNETTAALNLIRSLVLTGKVVVADAAHCQRETCQAVLDSGGDYVVTVKANQPQLLRDVEQAFVIPQSFSPLCG